MMGLRQRMGPAPGRVAYWNRGLGRGHCGRVRCREGAADVAGDVAGDVSAQWGHSQLAGGAGTPLGHGEGPCRWLSRMLRGLASTPWNS